MALKIFSGSMINDLEKECNKFLQENNYKHISTSVIDRGEKGLIHLFLTYDESNIGNNSGMEILLEKN